MFTLIATKTICLLAAVFVWWCVHMLAGVRLGGTKICFKTVTLCNDTCEDEALVWLVIRKAIIQMTF